ncbi:ATP-binding protein (plasmid) [Streptomyces sp. SDT5-1]|uniref:ATP-binding protein n=1 Tax=Streptomyces sp. SDT5-1 TaxID=3406418 RepID=UPI003FD369AD
MAETTKDRSRYASYPAQVRAVRRHVTKVLRDWGVDDTTLHDVVAVADELASNAVRHAGTAQGREFGMTLRLLETLIRVEVRDADPNLPDLRSPEEDLDAEGGRGLMLVDGLAANWGSSPEVLGKTVWADIQLAPSEQAAPATTTLGTRGQS